MSTPHADFFASFVRQMQTEADLSGVLTRIVVASISQIEGAEHAGITAIARDSVSTPAASDDLVREVDRAQYVLKEGPCLTAATDHQPVVRVDDLRDDPRWPAFSKAAVPLGILSMLSFQLYTADTTLGALNIYAGVPAAFTGDSVHTGVILATHAAAAAVAAAAVAQTDNLRIALQSRDTIGQAKGILMERYKITADQAFDLIVTASQHTHRKLRDVAAELADTGDLVLD